MVYCISFESEYNHSTWEADYVILEHSHTHNPNMDILYGMLNTIVCDSGAEHFNSILVF